MEPRLRREHLRFTPSRAQSEACQELLAALESTAADPGTTSCDQSISSHTEMVSRLVAVGRDMGLARWPRDSGSRLVLPDFQVEDEESHMDPCIIEESSSDEATDVTDEGGAPDEISSASSIKGNSRYAELEAGDEAFPSSPAALAALPTFLRSGELIPNDGGSSFASDDLDDAVGKFSYHLCTEEFENGLSSSTAIVYFSGILRFTPDGSTFERPSRYTPKLSAMIYCIRLCVLERMLPRFSHPKICWPMRPQTGGLKRFARFRDRFMCHGCQSSTGELLSLRSYGRALSRADGPNFKVHWDESGDRVGWEGGTLSMDQLRNLGKKALERAQYSMDRLLYGTRPIISLEDLQDKMSVHRQGYPFVAEPANKLERSYLNRSTKACLHPADGLMSSDVWKMDAVHRYLKEWTSLLRNIMLMMYLRGGQAPRTTEFSSVECYNGPSTSRGIYIHGESIVYVTRHSKARRMTNQEFQVARYLPKEDSNLVATYLALIRPFADMLNRVCFGYDKERRLMFASPDKVDKHWQSDVLTSALRNLTQELSPQPFGVQIYRQLSIVATERYAKEISRPFDLNDGKSAAADIEVVFAWQSGHRPMQRGTSYGIDAAYPDSLQPALLRVYRWVSCRWHEFFEKPQKLLEVADLDTPEPARQCGIGLKRCSHGAGDAPEPKRCRMSDVPKNNIARPMRASGFLASALFWEDRHDSTTEQK
jgi:hypothetical protein